MSEDIKELVKRLKRTVYRSDWDDTIVYANPDGVAAADALEAMAGEVADALPWKLFYKDGLDLEQIGKRLGKSPYEFSPWLYAPLISQLKDREQTALANLAAERDRLAGEVDTLQMKLAACGVGALANTERTVAQRVTKESPHWSASLGDVYHIVDKEMGARAERDRLAGEVERLKMLSVGTALETVAQKERAQKAEAERDRLKAALEEIGRQKTSEEMEGYEAFDADFEGGWDTVVTNARKALGGDA